jgi:hypothetical protein
LIFARTSHDELQYFCGWYYLSFRNISFLANLAFHKKKGLDPRINMLLQIDFLYYFSKDQKTIPTSLTQKKLRWFITVRG